MKKLQYYIDRMDRLSFLRETGIVALIGVGLVVLFGIGWKLYLGPTENTIKEEGQMLDVEINHLKTNDAYFHHFLRGIKKENGVLVLGTSESTVMEGINYYGLLNADTSLGRKFSAFSGAGRFAEIYFPLIASSPEEWKDLEVLVFVNPTYWRHGLSKVDTKSNKVYLNRYLTKELVASSKITLDEIGLYAPFFQREFGGSTSLTLRSRLDQWVDRNIRSLFYEDLRYGQGFKEKKWDFIPIRRNTKLLNSIDESFLDSLKAKIDPQYNCGPEYLSKLSGSPKMPRIDTVSTFRMEALEGMIKLSEKYGIRTTFLLGPYNGILADAVADPELIQDYEDVMNDIRALFEKYDQPFIDLGDLSYVNHTFRDVQHHSHYGGYLMYKGIKEYYENR